MATTYVDTTASGGQTDFEFTFPYLEDEHVKVEINGVATTAFTISTTPTQKVVLDSGATAGDQVRVRRRSAPNQNLVDFVNGSVLTESELDLAYRHNRYLAEEIAELNDVSLQIEAGGTQWDAKDLRIQNVGTPTDTTDAVTKIYLDNKVAQVSSGATQPPLKWQFTGLAGANGTYTVTGAEVLGDTAYEVSIDGLIQEPGVDFTVDPNTDTLTIVPTLVGGEDIVVIQRGFGVAVAGTVGTNSLVDGSVTTPKLANGAVTTAKIEDGAVTSDKISSTDTEFNYVNGGIGIGTLNEAGYDLTAQKIRLSGPTTQLWIKDDDATDTPTEIAISLNGRALRFGWQDGSTSGQTFAIFGRNLTVGGGQVTEMSSLTNLDGALQGQIAVVSDGDGGNPCLSMYTGTHGAGGSWKVLATPGSTVSSTVPGGLLLDEDDMASNSDTKGATQQSIKSYVDSQAGVLSVSNWTEGTISSGTEVQAPDNDKNFAGIYVRSNTRNWNVTASVYYYTDATTQEETFFLQGAGDGSGSVRTSSLLLVPLYTNSSGNKVVKLSWSDMAVISGRYWI